MEDRHRIAAVLHMDPCKRPPRSADEIERLSRGREPLGDGFDRRARLRLDLVPRHLREAKRPERQ